MMDKSERVRKRPATKAEISALTDRRVLEALEREEALGIKHPDCVWTRPTGPPSQPRSRWCCWTSCR